MPAVLLFNIPPGMRGLLLIALIAASMSTFDSNVHLAAGMMTRDIYQKYIRPKAGNREIIYMTWAFVVLLVTTGFLMAYSLKSVNEIWGWLVMGLGAGALVPAFLRLYWWRFNGGGFAIGTVTGVFSAIILRFGAVVLQGDPKHAELYAILTDERWMFSILLVFGLIGSVVGTFLTKKTDQKVLDEFYKTTKPFGLWNGFQNKLPENVRKKMRREHKNDWIALPFLLVWHVCLLLIPMQFIVQNFKALGTTFVIFLFASAGFYWFWFKKLPEDNMYNEEEDGEL